MRAGLVWLMVSLEIFLLVLVFLTFKPPAKASACPGALRAPTCTPAPSALQGVPGWPEW